MGDLEDSVRDCLAVKNACKGYEFIQISMNRKRYGSFLADFFNFVRKTHITGWRFNGVILINDERVVYKLVGGQPSIEEREEARNPLGPFQGSGEGGMRSILGVD
jgi:hypothetical protein